jgi:hypothetical protein
MTFSAIGVDAVVQERPLTLTRAILLRSIFSTQMRCTERRQPCSEGTANLAIVCFGKRFQGLSGNVPE